MSTELTVQQPQQQDLMTVILQAAMDQTVDVNKMMALADLKIKMDQHAAEQRREDAVVEFAAAKSRVQMKVPRVAKNGMIKVPAKDGRSGHNTPYALYEDIDLVLRPIMAEEGFSFSFDAKAVEGGRIEISLIVSHKLGHSERSSIPLAIDSSGSKNATQAIVSTNSYGKRTLICNWANIVTEGKDDNGASIPSTPVSEEQARKIEDMIAACEMKPGQLVKFWAHMGVDAASKILAADFPKAMDALRATQSFNRGAA